MVVYRLLYSDLATGTLLGELPFTSLAHSVELNAAGSWQATAPLDLYATSEDLGPGRTGVYIERAGVIVGNGIVWSAAADPDAGTLQLTGEGFWSYYRRRTMRATLDLVDMEQTAVAERLLTHAHALPHGDIGVVAQPAATGVLRSRSYVHTERKLISELVEELSDMDDGFDFYVDSAWEGGEINTYLNFAYPATGRPTEHVVELGRNVASITVEYDGTALANLVDGFGAGSGDAQLLVDSFDSFEWGEPYPVLEASINHTDITDETILQSLTDRRWQRGRAPVRRVTAKVSPTDIVPGSFRVGDLMRVRARQGWLNLDDQFRVVAAQLAVAEGGEELTLQLAGLETFVGD